MEYIIKKSFRKTMSLQVKDGQIIVKAPFFVTTKKVEHFILKHSACIKKRLEQFGQSKIDPGKIDDYKKLAKEIIPERVKKIASEHGKVYNGVKITSARRRWGSCTSKKNLNFSYRCILLPDDVRDYIIVHELSHLKEMNHSRKFWKEVESMMPNYKEAEKYLRENHYLYS